jgi:hypothetical protein
MTLPQRQKKTLNALLGTLLSSLLFATGLLSSGCGDGSNASAPSSVSAGGIPGLAKTKALANKQRQLQGVTPTQNSTSAKTEAESLAVQPNPSAVSDPFATPNKAEVSPSEPALKASTEVEPPSELAGDMAQPESLQMLPPVKMALAETLIEGDTPADPFLALAGENVPKPVIAASPDAPVIPDAPAQPEVLDDLIVKGIMYNPGGRSMALLSTEGSDDKTVMVNAGQTFTLSGQAVKVKSISRDSVTLVNPGSMMKRVLQVSDLLSSSSSNGSLGDDPTALTETDKNKAVSIAPPVQPTGAVGTVPSGLPTGIPAGLPSPNNVSLAVPPSKSSILKGLSSP